MSARFRIGIDVGHSIRRPGAVSARGRPEYEFNYDMAQSLLAASWSHSVLECQVLEDRDEDMDFPARAQRAVLKQCGLVVSLHHNSMERCHLEEWVWEGRKLYRSRVCSGFSSYTSRRNKYFGRSLAFARSVGAELVNAGFTPDVRARDANKEGVPLVVDTHCGLFEFSSLAILSMVPMPCVLIECGVIVNDEDEPVLMSSEYQEAFSLGILAGVGKVVSY